MVGGGMRQVGILAAAGLYALDRHVERLADDHANARRLAEGIAEIEGLSSQQADASPGGGWTNLVYFDIDGEAIGDPQLDAAALAERLQRRGVLAIPLGRNRNRMRMVTHLDIESSDIDAAIDALRSAVAGT